MSEGKTSTFFKKGSTGSGENEWLGAESHMPNLSQQLRRREPMRRGLSSLWMIGAVFAVGVAAGGLVMRLIGRRPRTS